MREIGVYEKSFESNTGWLITELGLQLYTGISSVFLSRPWREGNSYQTAGSSLVCRFASNLECDIVGSVRLDLDSLRAEVVEVLRQKLFAVST